MYDCDDLKKIEDSTTIIETTNRESSKEWNCVVGTMSTLRSMLCRSDWSTSTDLPKRTSTETWPNEDTPESMLHLNHGRTC